MVVRFRNSTADGAPAVVDTEAMETSSGTGEFTTLVDLLRRRAEQQPQRRTFTFLVDGEAAEVSFTNKELDARARAIASVLREHRLHGERVLLLYPPGLELIAAVFGCFYAGTIAILPYPADPGRLDRTLPRLLSIVDDAQASALLTTSELAELGAATFADSPRLRSLATLTTDDIDPAKAETWQDPGLYPNDLALLQYTSGSTDQPKGVMLAHGSLILNLGHQRSGWVVNANSHAVIWLPPYHDMGLIGGIFLWLYAGATVTLMSPSAFLQRPARWLQAVSRTKATHIGAPDFAYAMCARKITPGEMDGVSLATLDVAWNGAETVRPETLERFTQVFQSYGFHRQAFLPSYGLAEATLLVAVTNRSRPAIPDWHPASRRANAAPGGAQTGGIASCGPPVGDQRVVIVDPERHTPCEPGDEGEIWVAGPSLAAGYWNRPEETGHIFRATLANGEGPFLRTGDLGFLRSGELFITSRLKDLIIIRGRNIHPLDVERTAEASHPALRPGAAAAFAVDAHGAERVVVVQEVNDDGTVPLDEVAGAIRHAVALAHEVQPYAVVLIKPRSIHKTSSGKIQRRKTQDSFLTGALSVLFELRDPALPESDAATRSVPEAGTAAVPVTRQEIEDWIVAEVANQQRVDPDQIDVSESFVANGLDSASSVTLVGDLAKTLGVTLPETLTWDYPNIAALADHLAGLMRDHTTIDRG
jgi:acyl-CoA synthetase (AMP-forming)/AMP-acid ligase II/acyl carrier protein